MLTCRQVSAALASGDYHRLPRLSRWGLRLHVFLCVVCGRYNRQVMTFHDAVRGLLHAESHAHDAPPAGQAALPADARARLRESIKRAAP